MKSVLLPPVCPFASTEEEHFRFTTRDGASFRIWALATDHSWFLRVFVDRDAYVSYLVADRTGIEAEIAPLLPLVYDDERRRTERLLRRWGLSISG